MYYGTVIRLLNNVAEWKISSIYHDEKSVVYEVIIAKGRTADGVDFVEKTYIPKDLFEDLTKGKYTVFIDLNLPNKLKVYNSDLKQIDFDLSDDEKKLIGIVRSRN